MVRRIERAAFEAGLKFRPAVNIWNIGKTMWDLMILAHKNNFDQMMDEIDQAEDAKEGDGVDTDDYITKVENAIMKDNHETYSTEVKACIEEGLRIRRENIYSKQLQGLVRECLHVRMSWRPSPEHLFDLTRRGLENSCAGAAGRRDFVSDMVYYKDNVINAMLPGNYDIEYRQGDYNALVKSIYWDVEWPRLRLPEGYLDHARTVEGDIIAGTRPLSMASSFSERQMI